MSCETEGSRGRLKFWRETVRSDGQNTGKGYRCPVKVSEIFACINIVLTWLEPRNEESSWRVQPISGTSAGLTDRLILRDAESCGIGTPVPVGGNQVPVASDKKWLPLLESCPVLFW